MTGGFSTNGRVRMKIRANDNNELWISADGFIEFDINFWESIRGVSSDDLRGCTTEGPTNRAGDNEDLKATYGNPETNTGFHTRRGLDVRIEKAAQKGHIRALPPVDGGVGFGENWISLCFNTGGLCTVVVEEIDGMSVITFPGSDPLSRVRVVDLLTVNDGDVLSCENNRDVTITLDRSVGWTTN